MAKKHKAFNYFKAFETQMDYACELAELLIAIVEDYTTADAAVPRIHEAHEVEHKADLVCHEIYEAVTVDFITPFDRADIIAMARQTDNVLDNMEGAIRAFYMYDINTMYPGALKVCKLIYKCCEALRECMKDFSNFKNSKKLRNLLIRVNDIEEEADFLYLESIHGLYADDGDLEPKTVYCWEMILHRFENTVDSCETVANTMGSIIMKNA